MTHQLPFLGTLSFALVLALGQHPLRAQTVDAFSINPDGFITSAATEPDGKLLVGGQFLNISGTARSRLARLGTDGAVDAGLTAGATTGTQITAIVSHPDGTVLVGGNFTGFGGEMHGHLAHVQSNGTVDSSFTTSANGSVSALAMQADGRILVGGTFTTLGGQSHIRIARLNANGTVDATFNPIANDEVVSMLVQADGAIVIAGRFTQVNGTTRNRVARLSATGALDLSYDPNCDGVVTGMARQTDGRVLIFGTFTTVGGVARGRHARLQTDGSLDLAFELPTNTRVDSMVTQSDGGILVAGTFADATVSGMGVIRVNAADGSFDNAFTPVGTNSPAHLILDGTGHVYVAGPFTQVEAQARRYVARVVNPTAATQVLEVGTLGSIVWRLGGSMPVPSVVHFQASVGGTVWTDLGFGLYDEGEWTLAAPALPVGTTHLRAHGVVPTNGSDSSAIATVVAISVVPGGPAITANPQPVSDTAGSDLSLSVTATGDGVLSYQWRRDNVDIAGATASTLMLPSAQLVQNGTYTVVVSNTIGSVESQGVLVAVTTPPDSEARLLNLSTRALTGTDANVMIPGFVVSGTGTKQLLIRAVGPTLGAPPFNIAGVLPDPEIVLKRWNPAILPSGAYEDVAANDEWMTNANAAAITTTGANLGAFALANDHEAALLVDLIPGQYTVVASGVGGSTGLTILEVYDADETPATTSLINLSNRGFAGTGAEVMIPGFVISPEGPKTVLLRVVGPTLATVYGVTGTMADPMLSLYRQEANNTQTLLTTQDNWEENPGVAAVVQVAQEVQAFPLAAGSADAAVVMTLEPGVYSVIGASAVPDGTGVVLVELYIVP